jgi:hypothetical protein
VRVRVGVWVWVRVRVSVRVRARSGARVGARAGARDRVRGPALTCDAARGVQLPKHDDKAQQVAEVAGDAKDVHEHDGNDGWHGVGVLSRR